MEETKPGHRKPENSGEIEKIKAENSLFKQILDKISDGVYITDEREVITWINHSAAETDGVSRDDILGKTESEVFKNISQFHRLTTRSGQELPRRRTHYYLPCGRRVDLILTTRPYFRQGRLAAVYTIGQDLDQLRKMAVLALEPTFGAGPKTRPRANRTRFVFNDIVGVSPAMKNTLKMAKKAALSQANILICGETGTGKELMAQSIHNAGQKAAGQFVAVNCSAIPESLLEGLLFGTAKGAFTGAVDNPGLFETADGGSLFLDEINSMPMELQAKLLRVLQEREVQRLGAKKARPIDCRIISAANADPMEAVKNRALREDIYFRLSAITIEIPPLRARLEDLEPLAAWFMKRLRPQTPFKINDFSGDVWRLFREYAWPGNVREFEHALEFALTMMEPEEKVLKLGHLPPSLHNFSKKSSSSEAEAGAPLTTDPISLPDRLNEFESQLIKRALAAHSGNLTRAAASLGMSRQALSYRLSRLAAAGLKMEI